MKIDSTIRGFRIFVAVLGLAACSGSGGGGGAGNNGGAAAGFVVAARNIPAEINIYRAGQPNVPIETVAGATFIGPMYEDDGVFPLRDESKRRRLGIVYGKLAAPDIFFELGVFLQSQRVILAAEEYYVVRIYRREPRGIRLGNEDTRLTGLVENEAGRRDSFRSAQELWRLLVRGASDGVRSGRRLAAGRRDPKRNTRGVTRRN